MDRTHEFDRHRLDSTVQRLRTKTKKRYSRISVVMRSTAEMIRSDAEFPTLRSE